MGPVEHQRDVVHLDDNGAEGLDGGRIGGQLDQQDLAGVARTHDPMDLGLRPGHQRIDDRDLPPLLGLLTFGAGPEGLLSQTRTHVILTFGPAPCRCRP